GAGPLRASDGRPGGPAGGRDRRWRDWRGSVPPGGAAPPGAEAARAGAPRSSRGCPRSAPPRGAGRSPATSGSSLDLRAPRRSGTIGGGGVLDHVPIAVGEVVLGAGEGGDGGGPGVRGRRLGRRPAPA